MKKYIAVVTRRPDWGQNSERPQQKKKLGGTKRTPTNLLEEKRDVRNENYICVGLGRHGKIFPKDSRKEIGNWSASC